MRIAKFLGLWLALHAAWPSSVVAGDDEADK
jgi:hypothetical protein